MFELTQSNSYLPVRQVNMISDKGEEVGNCVRPFVCGEILSPSNFEKGHIYVGGLLGISSSSEESNDGSDRQNLTSKCLPVRFAFNGYSDDDSDDSSDFEDGDTANQNQKKQQKCPNCGNHTSTYYEQYNTKMPPYCTECESFYISGDAINDAVLDKLMDYGKGKIVFIDEDDKENKPVIQTTRHYGVESNSNNNNKMSLAQPSFSFEDEFINETLFNIQNINTDDEQLMILKDVHQT